MSACLICLGASSPGTGEGGYHAACLRRLFGVDSPPRIDLDLQHLPACVAPPERDPRSSGPVHGAEQAQDLMKP